ncbi:hypothetical protein ACIQWY_29605 [Streptomyces albidoflavus]
MAEGMQAGRLDVPVVADLAGFAEQLRTKVEAAARGVKVKIEAELKDSGLRERVEESAREASAGVTATIKAKIDRSQLRDQLNQVARQVARQQVTVPVQPDGDGRPGTGLRQRLGSLIRTAQRDADRTPVKVGAQLKLPTSRRSLRMLGIGAIVSLLQPAAIALTQYAGGLTALASAAAPAVGVLGAVPGLITAAGTAAIGTVIAFGGFTDAVSNAAEAEKQLAAGGKLTKAEQQQLKQSLDELSPSARKVAGDVVKVGSAWSKVRRSAQEGFFSELVGQIRPATKSLVPLLSSHLGDLAGEMGSVARRGAEFMQTGVFRRDFKTIAGSNRRIVSDMAHGVGDLGRATMDFLVASGPFAERVSAGIRRGTQWVRASAAAGRETGSLARFLDHAGDKAVQLGRASRDLIKGLGGVGRAGMDTGNALLDSFEGTMTRFRRWANSADGQGVMKEFFADAAPTFNELNRLVGDFVRGLGRAATDGKVVDLIRQIRLELMPALGTFFEALGESIGPALISLISNLATAVGNLSGAGAGLGLLLSAFSGLLQVFNGLVSVVPGANTALAVLLGTLLALKVVTAVSGVFRNVAGSIGVMRTQAAALGQTTRTGLGPGVIGPQISGWQRAGLAYQGAARQAGGLRGALAGVAAANRASIAATGGLLGALGGPLGVAMIGLTVGLGLLATRQEAAARAAKAHEERVNSLSQALATSGGVIDANVRAQAAQLLQDTELADGKGKLMTVLGKADIKLGEVTDAYLKQGTSLADLEKRLQATADANQIWVNHAQGGTKGWNDQGLAAIRAKEALATVRGELEKGSKKQRELNEAVNNATDTGTSAYTRLQAAVQGFSDKTSSADERVTALKAALDALNGNTDSFHDAMARMNSVMLSIDDTIAGTIDRSQGWGKALVGVDGLVNTSTRNGQTLNSQLTELHTAMLTVATRAREAGEQGLMPMSEAMAKGTAAMEDARAKAIALGRDMGLSKDRAKDLADQMGFVPDTVNTVVTASGLTEADAGLLELRTKLDDLGKGQAIQVEAPPIEVRNQIEALGFVVQRIPGSKKVSITAPTDAPRAALKALAADLAATPKDKTVSVQAAVGAARKDLQTVRDEIARVRGKKIEITAPTELAQAELRALGFTIKTTKGKKVEITAPTGSAIASVNALDARLKQLKGRTISNTVTTTYISRGTTGGQAIKNADGNILRFAEGGINRAVSAVRAVHAYAAGGIEKHVAQIARGGPVRIWNEPETHGEAYIPYAPSKRARSKAILEQVARDFGGQVMYFANGGFNRPSAAAALNRQQPAAARPRPRRQQEAAAALVGGDLNLNFGSVGTVGNAMEDAMYELRKVRLGGGPHA